jgi:cyclopropane fatty-acyl-phospholipid synthase-like methyltransferase
VLGNGRNLKVLESQKFDLIFTITVLQHMPTRFAKNYLSDITRLLALNGICVIQTLTSYGSSMKRLSSADLFSVAYSKDEFDYLISQSGLRVVAFAKEEYNSDKTFWGFYLVKKEFG